MKDRLFRRDDYVSEMMAATIHTRILVVTGLRKVGKSTLVRDLFLPEYQKRENIDNAHAMK